MSYRPVLRTLGLGSMALLLCMAGAMPAAAAPVVPVDPSMAAAMQRDLGVSASQVPQRLAQEAAAESTATTLRTNLGDSFSGAWIDSSTGKLVVGTTDSTKAGEIKASGALPVIQRFPEKDLQKVQAKLDKQAAKGTAQSVGAWYIDAASNAVVVSTTSEAEAKTFVENASAGADPVKIQATPETPKLFANLVGGNAILAASGGRCSVGFSARSATATFVITAGHCTELGGNWNGFNGTLIGPVSGINFPTDDFGSIRVTNTAGWTGTSQVAGNASMLGSTVAAIGASVCRSGSTTGYRCGTLQARNATVNYGGGDIVYGLTRTSACAEPGDSGGSFVSGRQAQGMTSGGSGNCTIGGTTYFQPVNEALTRYGLTLVTG